MTSITENPGNGGRGRKAPYDSTHYRIPLPLKPAIENIASRYRDLVSDYDQPDNPDLINAAIDGTDNLAINKKAIILEALASFIEAEKRIHGKNGAQKDKEFSLDTRKWDAFRNFQKFVEESD